MDGQNHVTEAKDMFGWLESIVRSPAPPAWALLAFFCVACGSTGTETGKYEMYLDDQGLTQLSLTFLKGRCCGRLGINAKDAPARAEMIRVAELCAEQIPLDGSLPTSVGELKSLVPAPAQGQMSDWDEDLGVDPTVGPRVIDTSAFDWGNGGAGPFDENGFEAVAVEIYLHRIQGWRLTLDLLYMSSASGADAAFHYRDPEHPETPYWDLGERIH